jgi:hypothetical protein
VIAVVVWLSCGAAILATRYFGGIGPTVGGALWFSASFGLLAVLGGFFRPLSATIVLAYGLSF